MQRIARASTARKAGSTTKPTNVVKASGNGAAKKKAALKAASKATKVPNGSKAKVNPQIAAKAARTTTATSVAAAATVKTKPASKKSSKPTGSVSAEIDKRINELGDWRGETLSRMRTLILQAVPQMTEEWKWNVPVWSHGGIVCTGETYKKVVKLTFAKGASIPDPTGLFNSSLEGNTRRAIDIQEGEKIDAAAFKALVKAAVAKNGVSGKREKKAEPVKKSKTAKLLSGGNPQIAKADGNAPVQAYIAAMPGWKRELGKQLDQLIMKNAPKAKKAVKWNSPFYGIEGKGWFVSFHVFTRFVKVTFFKATSLKPIPPGKTDKSKEARWIDIYEDDKLDTAQMAKWVKQAAAIPGWIP